MAKKKTVTIAFTCLCGAKLKLGELGRGYLNAFGGKCPECQREWFADWDGEEKD